jgi:hypothetical protein
MTTAVHTGMAPGDQGFYKKLNGAWHEKALYVYLAIVIAHWVEHILQAIQIWGMGWARPDARGALGLVWPWLVSSEWLHFGYAVVMLIGLIILRPGFVGRARMWWNISLGIQAWHLFEHALLFYQGQTKTFLWGSPVPTSVAQALGVPRPELHLFYNAIVFIPMVIGMYYHLRPPAGEPPATCSCVNKGAAKA